MHEAVFFRPDEGYVGDVIPHVQDGEIWLYYLHDERSDPKKGSGWRLVKTRDFVAFEDAGVALPAGDPGDPDRNAYTGSVVVTDEAAHIFYTGQNPDVLGEDGASPVQHVMHAVSKDGLRTWDKDTSFSLDAPAGYESGDWRDPFVFRPSEGEPWRMLITARHAEGPERRRGVIAQCVSDDLLTWRLVEPFWDPRRYIAHECPEVFQWGDWWYLVYSEFSEQFTTRYRIARSAAGPWQVPTQDTVDGRAFYAAKSVGLDGRRFFVGWIATKDGERDDGDWQWAGDMSVLEAYQQKDGSLAFTLPRELRSSFRSAWPTRLDKPGAATGNAASDFNEADLSSRDGYQVALSEAELPGQFLAHMSVDIRDSTTECGLVIRATPDGDEGYCLRLEPKRHRMVFDRWPRRRTGPMQWQVSGDIPYVVELERPCRLDPGLHTIDVLVDGNALVAVIDDTVALSARIYDRTSGHLGVFVGEGAARFHDITVSTRDQ